MTFPDTDKNDDLKRPAYMAGPQGLAVKSLLPQGTKVLELENLENGQQNIELDGVLGKQVARFLQPPSIRIWRSASKCGLAVSKRDVATETGQKAREILSQEGLDVVVRETGGTAVPQGPGVLHVSFLLPRRRERATTDAYYKLLCWPLMDWLRTLGLEARTGELTGSYCDGTYNILVSGRKLVGTAQAWRGGLAGMSSRHPGYVLAHANLVVDYDLAAAIRRINRFYTLAGREYRVQEEASTTLIRELPSFYAGAAPEEKARLAGESLANYYRSELGVS